MSERSRIRFTYPGWDIAWWTVLMVVGGCYCVWARLQGNTPPWYIDFIGLLSIPAVALWFRVRPAGHFFLVFHGVGFVFGTAWLIWQQDFAFRSIMRSLVAFSTAAACLRWTRRILRENELEAEGVPPEAIKARIKREFD